MGPVDSLLLVYALFLSLVSSIFTYLYFLDLRDLKMYLANVNIGSTHMLKLFKLRNYILPKAGKSNSSQMLGGWTWVAGAATGGRTSCHIALQALVETHLVGNLKSRAGMAAFMQKISAQFYVGRKWSIFTFSIASTFDFYRNGPHSRLVWH